MANHKNTFGTIRSEGAILPPELLHKISGGQKIEGLEPEAYHLAPGERINESATRSWNRMKGLWENFRKIMETLPPESIGTTETRERWLNVLFQELGYGRLQTGKAFEMDGKTYPISHRAAEPVAVHLVTFRQDLDRRTEGRAGAAKNSPHSLVQEFLNRSDDHLWGFVSNGLKLRILRDNVSFTRAAYVEFDLQSMMENDAYSDFFMLFMLCHQSRVEVGSDESGNPERPESCWLEKWRSISIDEGVRALDDLRNGVQSAIETIGAGFLAHPANSALREKLVSGSLSTLDYYRQLLRQVYRMLFIFVAEDRDLLLSPHTDEKTRNIYSRYYSTSRLRELAGKKRGTPHADLWHQLRLVFSRLYSGCDALGLPALGSYLFREDSTPDLNDCDIANSDLLPALRKLCYTDRNNVLQPINYRNLGPEELGSVYESLLEMHPEIHIEARKFSLNVAAGSERKTTGSYYTPSSLVNCLLDSALEPVINEAVKGKTPEEQEKAMLAIKVCDPACGSGHFLIAAAHRMAKRLAGIRSGEEEPSPSVIQRALRDIIGRCIYGVDINPMSVELCKISLWLETLEPGRPLAFLDHHIQCGNSLIGCTPALLKKGIPDEAFNHVEGDDKAVCTSFKRRNKAEKQGIRELWAYDGSKPWQRLGNLGAALLELDSIDDSNLEGLKKKEEKYFGYIKSAGYLSGKFLHDAWCSAFAWKKLETEDLPYPITEENIRKIERNPHDCPVWMRDEIIRLADEYSFFHWHIAFPDVFQPKSDSEIGNDIEKDETTGWTGGFDCVLGNPPWERIKLQEKEFFAALDSTIANAPNAAARTKLIKQLPETNPALWLKFQDEKRKAECSSAMVRGAGFFPLCGRGDVNTYTIFTELNLSLLSDTGRCGCIVPSGIATDDTTKFFFQHLVDTESLVSLYDFENREEIFKAVHRSYKFCLLTMGKGTKSADFVFFATNISHLTEKDRHFELSLSREDIALLNPNTKTCPIFRSKKDAELTKYIYSRVPVLINENDPENGNPWGIKFSTMFHMSNDSHLFRTRQELEDDGWELKGNVFHKGVERHLPLYEAKMIHHYNHRFGDYRYLPEDSKSTQLPDTPVESLQDPFYSPLPRYWVEEVEVKKQLPPDTKYLMGWRDITNTTNERTVIAGIVPAYAAGDKWLLLFIGNNKGNYLPIVADQSSLPHDYFARQKQGGTSLKFFTKRQIVNIPPSDYETMGFTSNNSSKWSDFISSRALELSYTAWELEDFAKDIGYSTPPFIWNESRRFEIRCELDAAFFHLYLGTIEEWRQKGSKELLKSFPTPRHAVDYIMETFPIVKRKDEAAFGEYRTKRRILEIYDQMTECMTTGTPFKSALNPPPGPPSDENGNFIPMSEWDKDNWPPHIHKEKESVEVL